MLIARAAAEVAVEGMTNLGLRGLGVAQQKLVRGKNHPGRAKAALQAVALPKRFLERVEFFPLSQPFDGKNVGAIGLDRKDRAGLDR
jgi:hypothetical protein